MLKWSKRFLIGALGALLVALGFYDGVYAVDNNVSGKAPTTNEDATALTDLSSIRIYKALASNIAGCANATYAVVTTLPFTQVGGTFSYLDANQTQNGTYCYKATALDSSGNESIFSNTATKSIDLLRPSAPSNLTVN